jgi:signal transduction histidine kinase
MTGGIKVLVVEDNADQAYLVKRTLTRQTPPMDVTTASAASECVDALSRASFDVILLDHHLPDASGLELFRSIKARGLATPVVMVTGQGDERVAVEAMKCGAADYVIKTVDYFSSLPSVITNIVRQQALALENARLDREVRRRLRETEGLLNVAQALAASLDRGEIARRTTRELTALLEAEGVGFLTLDTGAGALRLEASAGAIDDLLPREIAVAPPTLTSLCRDRAALRAQLPAALRSPGLLCAPVATAERCFGVLVGLRPAGLGAPTEDEERLADGVAKQMALALENARLYQETQDALAEVDRTQARLVQGNTLRALGEMAAGTAHHLNNLLTVALGRLQLLGPNVEGSPALAYPMSIIDQALRDAASVVQRMQRFSRIGPADDKEEMIDLNGIAQDVRELTATQCLDTRQALGIPITVRVETAPVPMILANPVALREVVTNLVLNALDAMPAGGEITLRTFQEAATVCLAVSDTGIGMSSEVKQRAIEPFFTTKGPKGTGLGLSVAYGTMRRHGGDLRIDSVEGQGTTITLSLPLVNQPVAGGPGGAYGPEDDGGDTMRLLVVDDDDRVRSVIAEMLAVDGHAVVQATGGREALALLEAGAMFDLVLTDHGMPEMTGLDLLREIKTRWPDLAVGLVTGWGDSLEGLAGDVTPEFTLAKPVEFSVLRETIGGFAAAHPRQA